VVEDDQKEKEDAHQVAEHGQLNVGNHGEALVEELTEQTDDSWQQKAFP